MNANEREYEVFESRFFTSPLGEEEAHAQHGKVRVLRVEEAPQLHQSTLIFPSSAGPFLSQRRGKDTLKLKTIRVHSRSFAVPSLAGSRH